MIDDLKDLFFIKTKVKLGTFAFLSAISAVIETLALASLIPFLNVVSNKNAIESNNLLNQRF